MAPRTHKKNLIISYKNLTEELKEQFKEAYPEGYSDYLQRTTKPNGEPIFTVLLETEDTNYLVKFDVKIDTGLVEEDLDKDLYDDEAKEDDSEFAPISEAIDKEEGVDTRPVEIRHGSYEDIETISANKAAFESVADELKAEFAQDDEEDFDNYVDEDSEEEDDEPTDDDLLDIEMEMGDGGGVVGADGMLRSVDDAPQAPAKPKRGRPTKAMIAERAAHPQPEKKKGTRGRPRKNK